MRFKPEVLGPGVACLPIVKEHQRDFADLPERVRTLIGDHLYDTTTLLRELCEMYGDTPEGTRSIQQILNMFDRRYEFIRKLLKEAGMLSDPTQEIRHFLQQQMKHYVP